MLSQSDFDRCSTCVAYRSTLNRAVLRKTTATTPHSHTNHRYMSSPEKDAKLRELQRKNRVSKKHISRLSERLAEHTSKCGVCVDDVMKSDLDKIMKDEDQNVMNAYPKDSFPYVFWRQQKEAQTKHPNGMRWHPLMIRSVKITYKLSFPSNTKFMF